MECSGAQMTPLEAIARGLVSGAVRSAARDLVWYWRHKRGGGKSHLPDWEFSTELRDWESAPAPAKIGKHLYEGFFQRGLPADRAALTNNIMHWGYGMSWGGLYGIVAGSLRCPRVIVGTLLGAGVWVTSYVILPLARVYKPIWEYDARTLLKDFTAHLVYGSCTAGAFAVLVRLANE